MVRSSLFSSATVIEKLGTIFALCHKYDCVLDCCLYMGVACLNKVAAAGLNLHLPILVVFHLHCAFHHHDLYPLWMRVFRNTHALGHSEKSGSSIIITFPDNTLIQDRTPTDRGFLPRQMLFGKISTHFDPLYGQAYWLKQSNACRNHILTGRERAGAGFRQ